MLTSATFEPAADFVDPRSRADFQRRFWPLCNGRAAPRPGAPGLHDRRCLEFLAAFYHLNLANHHLLAARQAGASKGRIAAGIAAVRRATARVEALEDRYAPIGFFGEPVMEGIRYRDLVFVRPEMPRSYRPVEKQSSWFAIPGLDAIPASELRGPVKLRRFGHGKMDF